MDLTDSIVDATKEIFSTMLMIEVSPEPPVTERIAPFQSSVSGMIGIAGAYKGMIVIHAPEEVAINLTSTFLGMDVAKVDDDVRDAMGELANMLGGSIKQVLSPGRQGRQSLHPLRRLW